MRRQRNNTQPNPIPRKSVNEIEASKLSAIEFKIMVIRMFKELSDNSKELQRRYKKLTENYTNMKKDI